MSPPRILERKMKESSKLRYYITISEKLKKENTELKQTVYALQNINKQLSERLQESEKPILDSKAKINELIERQELATLDLYEAKEAYDAARRDLAILMRDYQRDFKTLKSRIKNT